ncbi:MAG: cytochrome P450 [Pararhizobium sp.]
MGTMVKSLMEQGTSYADLVRDPALIPSAVEEAIRFEPPIFGTERITQEEVVIEGVSIPKGHVITALLTAANRDPKMVERPDEFDIHRSQIKHVSFGGGVHRCIGAPLAKLECEVLLQEMVRRFPAMKRADRAYAYDPNPGFRGLEFYWLCKS